jgi:hypothetical protein
MGEHVTLQDVTDINSIDQYDVLFYLDKVPEESPRSLCRVCSLGRRF